MSGDGKSILAPAGFECAFNANTDVQPVRMDLGCRRERNPVPRRFGYSERHDETRSNWAAVALAFGGQVFPADSSHSIAAGRENERYDVSILSTWPRIVS